MTEKYDLEKIKNSVICGDALTELKKLPDACVDMILCDLPYGTTACAWDTIIPFEPLWEQYKRIIKDNGAIVLTASQPFTSALVMSNIKMFKYEIIWEKEQATNFMMLKKQIGKSHENILLFYSNQPTFNPQKVKTKKPVKSVGGNKIETYGGFSAKGSDEIRNKKYPCSILRVKRDKGFHPTQKPVALGQYLIRTYTNEGDLMLDNTCGSGSFLVAAKQLYRNFIGIEISPEYCKIANQRLAQKTLF